MTRPSKLAFTLSYGAVFATGVFAAITIAPRIDDRSAALQPCWENPLDAMFFIRMTDWSELYVSGEIKVDDAGEYLAYQAEVRDMKARGWDVNDYMADAFSGHLVPEGLHEGRYIPSGCYAKEGLGGRVTYYRRPADSDLPVFVADPFMAELRARGETAAQRAAQLLN